MKNLCNRGFTLIELLMVITIIAILAGLLITLIPEVMLKVKIADTNVRMNAVHSGMAIIGQDEGSATFRLQQLMEHRTTGTPADSEPGLGGIFTFGPPNRNATGLEVGLPTVGTRPSTSAVPPPDVYGAWGFRGRGHLAFPWGKKFPDTTAAAGTTVMMGPERFLLRHMSPFNTRKILSIANILEKKTSDPAWGENQYMTNRKNSMGWNDAWGHPLVVASVLYQPTFQSRPPVPTPPGWKDGAWPPLSGTIAADRLTAVMRASTTYLPAADNAVTTPSNSGPMNSPTADDVSPKQVPTKKMLLDHMKLYQYNRSVYIAVAAVGPSARVTDIQLKSTTPADWANDPILPTSGILDTLWSQANWVCQQAKKEVYDQDWDEWSFDNPRWNGNKYDSLTPSKKLSDKNNAEPTYNTYTGKNEHCMLSAPLEYR
jgi:prepilin-type N-terminal cleavage/methylation domain-containing protein